MAGGGRATLGQLLVQRRCLVFVRAQKGRGLLKYGWVLQLEEFIYYWEDFYYTYS